MYPSPTSKTPLTKNGQIVTFVTVGSNAGVLSYSVLVVQLSLKRGKVMNKLFLIVTLSTVAMLVACASGPVEATRIVEAETEVEVEVTREVEVKVEVTRVVEVEIEVTREVEVEVEITREVEVTPKPSPTPEPISYEDYADWRNEVADTFIRGVETLGDVERVNLVRFLEGVMEVELNTKWASRDSQPEVTWAVVTGLASVAEDDMDIAWRKKAVDSEDFTLLLRTYSTNGDYRYQSETDYDTLMKLANRSMSYDEWVEAANAGFK